MMAPQQMQQLLSPDQLQTLIQQKQQALLLQQHLKEFYKKQQQQIYLQLLQQQPGKKGKEPRSQQLVFQRLLQLQQQQLLRMQAPLPSSLTFAPARSSSAEMQRMWKEMTNRSADVQASPDSPANKMKPTQVAGTRPGDQRSSSPCKTVCGRAAADVLYGHGVCNWPGCESVCENLSQFMKHICFEHTLDDRSTAQCRVQMQVVHQLELQLCKEWERLRAMMAHLRLPSLESQSLSAPPRQPSPRCKTPADPLAVQLGSVSATDDLPAASPCSPAELPPGPSVPTGSPSRGREDEFPGRSSCTGLMRRRRHPLVYSLSTENEFELYRSTDIRPPFTYATLIRQAIMESSEMQLTLNEIYNWFIRTFAYFRRNAATWKNAVRHNLSLHKCFVRVENMKGAVWTVDEVEYQRRRAQKFTGNPTLMKNSTFGSALDSSLRAELPDSGLRNDCAGRKSNRQIEETCAPESKSPEPPARAQQ